MSEQFTPGPWFIHDSLGYCVAKVAGLRVVADFHHADDPFIDARLIAAAPDLYEAVVGLLSKVDRDDCPVEWDRAEAAMAKAVDEQ